ncbi:MAG: radical SAM protein [Spirochaetes bacterium]|nr:radical SAM protein [Spirochaetota bacterium]
MIKEITAKSILRRYKKIDSWFISSYSINLYRGCTHNCVYCDGRNEKYQVEGEYGRDIEIKINALELLEKELDPARKRKPFGNGFMVVCGGVSDSYQPFEEKYMMSRRTLELIYKYNHPVHILTKSTLVERDIDLFKKINEQNKAIVSFSFSSVNDEISRLLEPGVPSPSQRLNTIKRFKDAGLTCGMYLMPVVPFITDSSEMIEQSVTKAKETGIDFIIFGGMTLKEGRQKDYFMNFLNKHFPQHTSAYEKIYSGNTTWGAPNPEYVFPAQEVFDTAATRFKVPKRIPSSVFKSLVSTDELVILILEQLDYLSKLKNKNSPYGYAAYSLSRIDKPIESLPIAELQEIKGIGPVTAKIVREIIETGKCGYYENLL